MRKSLLTFFLITGKMTPEITHGYHWGQPIIIGNWGSQYRMRRRLLYRPFSSGWRRDSGLLACQSNHGICTMKHRRERERGTKIHTRPTIDTGPKFLRRRIKHTFSTSLQYLLLYKLWQMPSIWSSHGNSYNALDKEKQGHPFKGKTVCVVLLCCTISMME